MVTNINSERSLSSAAEKHNNCSAAMTPGQTALVPLFLGKLGCNITFILDSSEDMRAALGSAKRLLIQTLMTKASHRNSLFNIMTFSGELTCWSHHMRPCAPDTVYTALSWIHSISCSPGRGLLAALTVAFADPTCHAVHLLCTKLPDHPEVVLTALPSLSAGRPVNVFYLQDSGVQLDCITRDYMQRLTRATRGSCHVITVAENGALEQVIPLCVMENSSAPSVSSAKCCCPSSSVLISQNMSPRLLRCSLGNPLQPVTSCASCQTSSPQFFPGCRVLARREVDGLYHMGTVIQQVQSCGGVWVVEFDRPENTSLGVVSSQRQLVCSPDMVNHTRAHRCCLVPGDAVLSPWEPDLRRYGPGRVMAATERRDGSGADGVTSLRVLMWNSCVSLVPAGLVSPISASQHGRIVRELQAETSASSCCCCSWRCARSSSCTPQLSFSRSQFPSYCFSATNQQSHLLPPSFSSMCGRMDGFGRAEQVKQEDLADTDVRSDSEVPSSSSSSSSSLSLSEDKTRAMFPPAGKLRIKDQRPPWRYWRRTGPEPQHRQPGSAAPRKTSQPIRFFFPVPQASASPNHSSLFQSLPGTKGRRVNIQTVFESTNLKPHPPAGQQPFSGINATTVSI